MKTQAPLRSTPRSPHLRTTQLNLSNTFNGLHTPCPQLSTLDCSKIASTPQRCSPGSSEMRSSSPNYFSLKTESKVETRNSDVRSKDSWTPSFFLPSVERASPNYHPVDPNSGLEAFRKQMEANHGFNLSHSKLSLFASSSVASPRPAKLEKRSAKCDTAEMPSPKFRPPFRSGLPIELFTKTVRNETELQSLTDLKKDQYLQNFTSPEINNYSSQKQTNSFSCHHQIQNKLLNVCADKVPSKVADGPAIITPSQVREMIENLPESAFLLLDLRVFPLFSHSHIKGALNLCIPTTLLKRPSFNLQKLKDTFSNENDKVKFSKWQVAKHIVVYDSLSDEKDAASALNTLKKFSTEGWNGSSYILQGGFEQFVRVCPNLVEHIPSEVTQASKISLSLGTSAVNGAPVAGGCLLPAANIVTNPFFSNIRQNQDLIGGVGQIDIKLPERLNSASLKFLPRWLVSAVEAHDHGKQVSNKYLRLEQEELATMTKALSSGVSNRSANANSSIIKLAGIEKGEKNRYNNIWPYEHSRVKLLGRPAGACDYVNASHIKASRTNKRYIASQGPLPATFEDFWSIIWDQDVRVIVMLTAEVENGQLKCHSYWTSQKYGSLEVKILSEKKITLDSNNDHDYSRRRANTVIDSTQFMRQATPPTTDAPHAIVRKLALSHSAYPFSLTREVTQVQYSAWPDFGAPASASQVLGLVELTNFIQRTVMAPNDEPRLDEPEGEESRPMLVHCSAGCGRTGTFCTIDSVIDMLKRQRKDMHSKLSTNETSKSGPEDKGSFPFKPAEIDSGWVWDDDKDLVEQTVEDFRSQRISMVQNLRQFVLCYEAILEWIARRVPGYNKTTITRPPVKKVSHTSTASYSGSRDRCGSVW
ncbi:hypothetical protein K3495_g10222 [Podosphaera aphanis]|nr:hypothetical protein K3495_g10222 [Podosphaera aphanis]